LSLLISIYTVQVNFNRIAQCSPARSLVWASDRAGLARSSSAQKYKIKIKIMYVKKI
jgi:hypothetical protein